MSVCLSSSRNASYTAGFSAAVFRRCSASVRRLMHSLCISVASACFKNSSRVPAWPLSRRFLRSLFFAAMISSSCLISRRSRSISFLWPSCVLRRATCSSSASVRAPTSAAGDPRGDILQAWIAAVTSSLNASIARIFSSFFAASACISRYFSLARSDRVKMISTEDGESDRSSPAPSSHFCHSA